MSDCNTVVTPTDKGSHLQKEKTGLRWETVPSSHGILDLRSMFDSARHRYITQYLSQSNKAPSLQDWNAAKRVLRYLKGTETLVLCTTESPHRAVGVRHATPWGTATQIMRKIHVTGKSTSGYSFMPLEDHRMEVQETSFGSFIHYRSWVLRIRCACQEAIWLRQLCKELHMDLTSRHPSTQTTWCGGIVRQPRLSQPLKTYRIRWHFIRDLIPL